MPTRRTRQPRITYRLLGGGYTPPRARQTIKAVWGLGRLPHHIDVTIIGDDSTLMDMDAPECIPAGSMLGREQRFADQPHTIWIDRKERMTLRSLPDYLGG